MQQHEDELMRIRMQNHEMRQDAKKQFLNQYRTSSDHDARPARKIEEDYSMFEEQPAVEEELLEDIIEEAEVEESDSEDNLAQSQEERETMRKNKEELRNLRTQLLNIKEKLEEKETKIDFIRETLKKNKVQVNTANKTVDIWPGVDDQAID